MRMTGCHYIDGVKEGADLVVDACGFIGQGYENGYFIGGSLFDNVTTDMSIYREEIFGPVVSVVRADSFDTAVKMVNDMNTATGQRSLLVTVTPPAPLPTALRSAWSGSMCRSRYPSPIILSAAGSGRCLVTIRLMAWKVCVSIHG